MVGLSGVPTVLGDGGIVSFHKCVPGGTVAKSCGAVLGGYVEDVTEVEFAGTGLVGGAFCVVDLHLGSPFGGCRSQYS